MSKIKSLPPAPIALWGGLEATVNRVRDHYFSQMDQNGHASRISDLDRFAALGITALRYPVLWELIAPDGLDNADWSWPDERLPALRNFGITPIVGLVHHGSGPRDTSLVDPGFAEKLAAYAGAVARRYPWIDHYTPVNEPCTTARFCGLYGLWYPHQQSDQAFVRALLNQCKGVVLSMQAIRAVNPQAKLVQTDDLGKTYSTPEMADQARFYNDRRWLPWDLLCGMVGEDHALWRYLRDSGASEDELRWFRDHPCPPDVIGINYYITSERWLDHRGEHYPQQEIGAGGYADIVAPRALATPRPGIAPLLVEAWERYGLPLAVTEAHIDANREDQLRWLLEIWQAAGEAQREGVDMRAVTVWSLLGAFDWNCLVTERKGYYETGAYDLRGPQPRPTALATLMRELATGRPPSSPVLQGLGPAPPRRPRRRRSATRRPSPSSSSAPAAPWAAPSCASAANGIWRANA
jgi:dTDP-4-dehydrorhamnose reductase